MIKMGKNEEDILLEAEDKIATLKTIINAWHDASHNEEKGTAKSYCLGRVQGLEVCMPTIKMLENRISELTSEIIDLRLEAID